MQRGSIKQHGKHWVLKYREWVTKDGKQIRRDRYEKLAPIDRQHQTRESVQPLADLILAPLNAGLRQSQSVDSVLTFLETFLEKGEGGRGRKLGLSTRQSYKVMFNLAMPFLPDVELREVRTPHIDRLLRNIAESHGDEPKAQTTYRNLKNFLSSAFRYAVRNGLMDFNPVRDAAIPEGKEANTHAYMLKESRAIVKALKDSVSKAVVTVAIFTGLRSEEIKGLKWEDYEKGEFHIRRAIVQGQVVELKTKASKSSIPVVKTVAKALGKLTRGDGYIFHGDTGEPLRLENVARRNIAPQLEAKNLKWHGWHAFRRGLATQLHDLGVADLTIKHLLRHSTTDVTEKHYIKVSAKKNRQALVAVEKRFVKIR